jgi:hypothetical protein
MPYGRSKALIGVVRVCRNVHCQKEFTPGQVNATYCTLNCRNSAANQRLRAKVSAAGFKDGYRDGLRTAHTEIRRAMVQQIFTRSNLRVESLLSELGLGFDDLGDEYGAGGGVAVDYPVIGLGDIDVGYRDGGTHRKVSH